MSRGTPKAQGVELSPLAGAAGIFQNHRWPMEERRMEVEKQRDRPRFCVLGHGPMDEGFADGACYGGCCSGLSILEAFAGNGIGRGTLSPVLQRNAGASGVSPLLLGGSGPISTLSAKPEGAMNYYYPIHGAPCSSFGPEVEQREQVDLLGQLRSLCIDKEREAAATSTIGNSPSDPSGIWSQPCSSESSESGFHLRHSSLFQSPLVSSDPERSASLIPETHCHLTPNWLRPCRWQQSALSSRTDGLCSEPWKYFNECHHLELGLDCDTVQEAKEVDPSVVSLLGKKRTWSLEHRDETVRSISMHSQPKELYSSGNSLLSVSPVANPQCFSAIAGEDSFILQGKLRHLTGRNAIGFQRERKDGRMSGIEPQYLPPLLPRFQSLSDIQGIVSLVARDQQGCRFLQNKFDEGTRQEREMIFSEIKDHVPELMVNPFGNYLVQKVLDVCSEDQRLEIILILTKNPTELVRISLNMHGTRAVQRLIESLKDKEQTSLVISALQPGFLSLIKDPNGNHVIQRCLQHFSREDSKFIFEAAARHCVDIATHRHGCCVLQRCIAHSAGQHRARLLAEVSANGLMLAQDAYGNYAVQYVLEMRDEGATQALKRCFEGRYAHLARQKFSSNVVEKCLGVFDDASRRRIVAELLSVPCFDHLLQDPYANYVIQSALVTSKGQSRSAMVEAIRAHEVVLKTSPYCKRIFNLLSKR